ncbi:unnamed protein product [Mesocestoides corti]|uniref:Secreted protein n=2 Tax=Mesocestoides corti TaxID=53468 RepID=A0A0R3U4M3_MESCO|nr:unnamed protein product [Mesocestoides corti]
MLGHLPAAVFLLLATGTEAFWVKAPTQADCEPTIRLYERLYLRHNTFVCCNFPHFCTWSHASGSGGNRGEALRNAMWKAEAGHLCRLLAACTFIEKPL